MKRLWCEPLRRSPPSVRRSSRSSIPETGDAHLRTTLSTVRDAYGRALYLFAQCQDVSQQRTAEAEFRQSERRFRLLVEAVEDYAIFMLDPAGHVTSWNAGAQRSKGWTEQEIVGQHFRVFYPQELQSSGHPEHELELALRDGVYQEEGWRVRKDGSQFWAHVTITTVRDEDGTHHGFAKVTRDNTERMRMLEQQQQYAAALAEANQQLERANVELASSAAEQAEFLAITAHELRGPVGVLGMSAATISKHWDTLEGDERDEIVAGMQSSATRLQRLLGDLLTAVRLQASTLDLAVQDVDIVTVLGPVLQRLRRSAPEVEVLSQVPDGVLVRADAGRLAQILDNLLANAVSHGRSPVRVRVSRAHDMVDIEVTDDGDGVPPALQDRIFERFVTSGGHGTGLGLHIVRGLARAQAGEAVYRPGEQLVRGLAAGRRTVVTIRVLLVDDVADVRRLVRVALKHHGGFEVVGEAEAGTRAIELAATTRPDIVLLDLGLPDIAGRELLTRLRDEAPHTKVIVFTGQDVEDRAYFEANTSGYVVKDAELDYLIDLLEDVGRSSDEEAAAEFSSDPSSVPDARDFVRGQLEAWGANHLREDASLIVTELATNAVIHADSAFGVRLKLSPRLLRIEVTDTDPASTPEPQPFSETAEGGRGMVLISALSASWGVETKTGNVKVTWAEVGAEQATGEMSM